MLELINQYIDSEIDNLIKFRRLIHSTPELSFKEFETTNRIIEALGSADIKANRFKETTGVYVDLEGKNSSNKPKVLIRADIDALPIQDLKDCKYKSRNDGVMHACGHDVHTAVVLGVVKFLNQYKDKLSFNVRAIFQPAEELGLGANALISQGVLDNVSSALSLHVDPTVPLGCVAIKPGAINAAVIEFQAEFRGVSAHAARIYQGVDAILPAARFICESYSHIPQKINGLDPHLLYIGQINSGTASNIVSSQASMLGTIRAFNSEIAQKIYLEISKVGDGISSATGAEFSLKKKIELKAVVNDPNVTYSLISAASKIIGLDNVIGNLPTSMGGEDFGAIMEKVPGAMMRVGVDFSDGISRGLHTPKFDVPESCISIAAKILIQAILDSDQG